MSKITPGSAPYTKLLVNLEPSKGDLSVETFYKGVRQVELALVDTGLIESHKQVVKLTNKDPAKTHYEAAFGVIGDAKAIAKVEQAVAELQAKELTVYVARRRPVYEISEP